MAKIKVFGLFLEKKSSDFVDFVELLVQEKWLILMFSVSFRVLTRSIRVKNAFLGHFLEFK